MNDLKTLIGRMNFMGGQERLKGEARRLALGAAKIARGPSRMRAQVEGMMRVGEILDAETASWEGPEAIRDGTGGPFDACDLRHWLELAERAGVPYIPARTVLTLTEDELSSVDQKLSAPERVAQGINEGLRRAFPEVTDEMLRDAEAQKPGAPDPEVVAGRLFDAMDDIPRDWMVRSNISGSSMLKALAGSGVIGDPREGSRLAKGIEVGAGWVQVGNRRRIDATDQRFVETFACGHKPEIHYLARPWVDPARKIAGEDPHRHGTPFAGKAEWPAEWRVFVRDGEVTGVASYYSWIGEVTPENASRAIEAADLAARIVDAARGIGAAPRFTDLEIFRAQRSDDMEVRKFLDGFPRDGVSCTLDFMETPDGMVLLEGGPPHSPVGGGFPCAFAGHGMWRETGLFCDCSGVALAMRPDINLAEPGSWPFDASTDGVLGWDEAADLAARFEPDRDAGPEPE